VSAAQWLIGVMWVALTAYVLLGGADFGGGAWDLLAGNDRSGERQRALIEHSIGPVWEANHVWLIFVIVLCWTGFPPVFAAVASTMYIPLMLVALGIIARGAAFAFRKVSVEPWQRRLFGATFAASSVLTPFFLGTVAGGIASGRVPVGIAAGDLVTSWVNPTSLLAGVLAVGTAAHLAAVYLCADAYRDHDLDLAELFRRKAVGTAAIVGVVALGGIAVLRADAPVLYDGLTGRALPMVAVSAAGGLVSLVLLARRRYVAARLGAATAVAAVLWGWALAQYPTLLLPAGTIDAMAADPAVLRATLVATAVGTALLIPSLAWLFILVQRERQVPAPDGRDPSTR
jgi:cytochrome d ubiquinol oxidase subunit II